MEADSAVCKMTRQTTNTQFWNMVAEDYYYKCDQETCANTAIQVTNPAPNKIQTDTLKTDWTAPVLDNDPLKPYCTPYPAAEILADPYLG